MKSILAIPATLTLALGACLAHGQGGHMMSGGGWHSGWMGGYGGVWIPVLLAVIAGLVAWVVMKKRK